MIWPQNGGNNPNTKGPGPGSRGALSFQHFTSDAAENKHRTYNYNLHNYSYSITNLGKKAFTLEVY